MRNKTPIVFIVNGGETQARSYKVVGLFADIYHHTYKSEQKERIEKGKQKIFEYVPVKFFHAVSEMAKDSKEVLTETERTC